MKQQDYDYIIVGAGSAGCVVATRIIQQTDARVLLLEAGGSDENLFVHMPACVAKVIATKSWDYTTEPDPQTGNRQPPHDRCSRQDPGWQQFSQRHDLYPWPAARL